MLAWDASVLERLQAYASSFADAFRRRDQARWLAVYLQGLLAGGGRKSAKALADCVSLPADMAVEDVAQALQNFVNQSPWDERQLWRRYRTWTATRPAGHFVIADVVFPKQGQQSVGVQRQLGGERGKKINCQLAVSVSYVSAAGAFPLTMRLYLPRSWQGDPRRLDAVGVPPEHRGNASKRAIALELLDELRAEGLPGNVVVANAAYGTSPEFRDALAERGWSYLVGANEDLPVVADNRMTAASFAGYPADVPLRPLPLCQLGPSALVAHAGIPGRSAWLRVWLENGQGPAGDRRSDPYQLLIEEQPGGMRTWAVSNLQGEADSRAAARLWNSRRLVEASFETMKEQLGLDHFEGRSWRGFHHHACLVTLAYGFLVAEQARPASEPVALTC